MLSPMERLSLPSQSDKVVWTGGDATLDLFAFIDWTFQKYFLLTVTEIFLAVKKMMCTENSKLIIAVSEPLAIVIGAIASGPTWTGRLIFYVGDNQNAITWLEARKSKNAYARFLLILLQLVETRHGFTVIGF